MPWLGGLLFVLQQMRGTRDEQLLGCPCKRSTLLTNEPQAGTVASIMTEAFKESAERHWYDAALLEKAGRHANANQLVGFAAECAIKAALCLIKGFTRDGQLERPYRRHIDELWEEKLHLQSIEKRFRELAALLRKPNPFHDWSIDHRYAREGTVSEEASRRHRIMTSRLLVSAGIIGMRAGS